MLGYYLGRMLLFPLIPPEHVYFSITNRCNLRCRMCSIDKTPAVESELSLSEIGKIILQISDLGVRHLILSGGEPLLREDLAEIVDFASEHFSGKIDIITNGILFNDRLIKELLDMKLNHITFSIDGFKKTNDQIRGDDSFDKSINNIRRIHDYKKKTGLLFPTLGINFTVMDKNINQMLKMVYFTRDIGCNCIVFQPLLSNNIKMFEKSENDFWPGDANIKKLEKIIIDVKRLKEELVDFEICTDNEILDCMPEYFRMSSAQWKFKCFEAIKRIVIGYDGRVWSCAGIYGDLKEKRLKEIWFSQEARENRLKFKECKEHCLQDCVYVSSDIISRLKEFLKKVDSLQNSEKNNIWDALLKHAYYYENILSNKDLTCEHGSFNPGDLRQGMYDLDAMKEIIKNYAEYPMNA